jgi:SAM-dependent methyltransferase
MLAMYLEAGWSDYLLALPDVDKQTNYISYPDPLSDRVSPDFFSGVARLAQSWTLDVDLAVKSLCDLGGGTGRAIFEIDQVFAEFQRLVLVETTVRLSGWAQRLLASDDRLPKISIVDRVGAPLWVTPRSRPSPIPRANERFTLVNASLEHYQPTSGFDIVTCLNVVDRHPCPRGLVDRIGKFMNTGGLLLLSSPFDFNTQSTPDTEFWIEDLNVLFDGLDAWHHVGQDDLFYEFRFFNRHWTRFRSQVVGKRWLRSAA